MSWSLCTLRVAATPLFCAHPCWIKEKPSLDSYTHLFGTYIYTHTLTAAEMSEEVKEKATGKSAHRKKKGKKVKDFIKPDLGL